METLRVGVQVLEFLRGWERIMQTLRVGVQVLEFLRGCERIMETLRVGVQVLEFLREGERVLETLRVGMKKHVNSPSKAESNENSPSSGERVLENSPSIGERVLENSSGRGESTGYSPCFVLKLLHYQSSCTREFYEKFNKFFELKLNH